MSTAVKYRHPGFQRPNQCLCQTSVCTKQSLLYAVDFWYQWTFMNEVASPEKLFRLDPCTRHVC